MLVFLCRSFPRLECLDGMNYARNMQNLCADRSRAIKKAAPLKALPLLTDGQANRYLSPLPFFLDARDSLLRPLFRD